MGGLHAVWNVELVQDIGYVYRGCARADVKPFGDLFVGKTGSQQVEYLPLADGKCLERGWDRAGALIAGWPVELDSGVAGQRLEFML